VVRWVVEDILTFHAAGGAFDLVALAPGGRLIIVGHHTGRGLWVTSATSSSALASRSASGDAQK
jgi:hypothetical protein